MMQFSIFQLEQTLSYYLNSPTSQNRSEGGKEHEEGDEGGEVQHINDNNWKEKIWQNAEMLSGMKRERLTIYATAFTVFYIVFGSVLAMLSHVVCTFLPILQTLKHIRKSPENQKNAENLLLYWIVFAVFTLFDFLPISSIPVYFFLKTAFFVHLYHPSSNAIQQIAPNLDTFFKLLESMWIQEKEDTTTVLEAIPENDQEHDC